ncbi:MAG: class I SAM-dependent methyltransferase [Nannocystaceae bacterium]
MSLGTGDARGDDEGPAPIGDEEPARSDDGEDSEERPTSSGPGASAPRDAAADEMSSGTGSSDEASDHSAQAGEASRAPDAASARTLEALADYDDGAPSVRDEPRKGRARSTPTPRKRAGGFKIRRGAVKIADEVARLVRAGHPWVFRHGIKRSLDDYTAGDLVQLVDEGGYPVAWGLVEGEGAIGVRVVSREESCRWDADAMAALLIAARRRREATGVLSDSCRLVHGEADGFPGLAVDRLGAHLLVYKYARVVETYLDTLLPLLESTFSPQGVYLQDRLRPVTSEDRRPPAFHMAGKPAPPEYEVDEDGLRFVVDVTAPVSPGLFLDLREGRRSCEAWARGREVLNLFSYTGAFALRAIRAGAAAVTNVDAAPRGHARCRQNLAASGFDPESCEAIAGDVFKHLERFRQRGRTFSYVVADPPPFSNVKGATFSALKDWSELIKAIAPAVARDGLVLAVCNAVRLTEEEFLLAIGEGARAAGREARLVGELGLPPDFPVLPAFIEGRYLKIKLLQFD